MTENIGASAPENIGASAPEVDLLALAKADADQLVALRRDLHAHPELGWAELRTTNTIRHRMQDLGLAPQVLPKGTGLWCDIGEGDTAVALRADIDALPIQDLTKGGYGSTHPGVSHACGHDVHTTCLVGATQILVRLAAAGRLPGRVRVIFQPAEETDPCGAQAVIGAGGLESVTRIFGLHCDPGLTVGQIATRVGPITAACDLVRVKMTSPGGHTARPHLTGDLVHALASVATALPAALSRRIDPRAGLSLVWGMAKAGEVPNVIPRSGELVGTLRCLDVAGWRDSKKIIAEVVAHTASSLGVEAVVEHERGLPPVDNDHDSVQLLTKAVTCWLDPEAMRVAKQSMGGEDFGWYQRHVPGAFARLGVTAASVTHAPDIHNGAFDVDESCIPIGVTTLVGAALESLAGSVV